MRTGKVLLVMLAVLAMAGAAGAEDPITIPLFDEKIVASSPWGNNDTSFNDASVTLYCDSGDTLTLVGPLGIDDPKPIAGGNYPVDGYLITDNYITVDGVNICVGVGGINNENCFSAALPNNVQRTGLPPSAVYDGVPPINLTVVEGEWTYNIQLRDFGSIYGNTALSLETTCSTEPPTCRPDLIANGGDGVGEPAGSVFVEDTCDGLQVTLTADEGFAFSEIHVGAGCVGDDNIPTNKQGHPKIGQFYSTEEFDYVWPLEWTVTIPYTEFEPCDDGLVDVAVHAVVKYLEDDCQQPVTLLATVSDSFGHGNPKATPPTEPAQIDLIFPLIAGSSPISSLDAEVDSDTFEFNGNAYDPESGIFYFSRVDKASNVQVPGLSDLFWNDLNGNQELLCEGIPPAAGATVAYLGPNAAGPGSSEGLYYLYIEQFTDKLISVFIGDNNAADFCLAYVTNDGILSGTNRDSLVFTQGDIAVKDGVIYGSLTLQEWVGSPASSPYDKVASVFATMSLDGTNYSEIVAENPNVGLYGGGAIQIAFGADGILYGVDAANSGYPLYAIDVEDGSTDFIGNLGVRYTDIASGPLCDVERDETAWGGDCDGGFGEPFADNGWAFYFKYDSVPPTTCEDPE